jgi:SAM-dependent methyltransferase
MPTSAHSAGLPAAGPNAEQIEYWNVTSGPRWVAVEARVNAQISPFGLLAMERATLAPGKRVLDVGCGMGQSALQLSERVGGSGEVVGVDISQVMLERAALRVAERGVKNVRLLNADAQSCAFDTPSFDVVYSRFGVMFFADPRAAFANLRRAMSPGGRLAFVCWQAIEKNPWMSKPTAAIADRVELPPRPAPDAPGPFAFADAERVRALLAAAGFEHIEIEPIDQSLSIGGGGSLDDAVTFLLEIGPAAAALREAGPGERRDAATAIRETLRAHATASGVVMDAAAWIVSAQNAG